MIHTADNYDVLGYHLQVPREYFEAGQISELPHNCYSYYPLGVEMLFLLAMCLRSGAYEGMYLAKMLHAVFAGLAVAGVFVALNKENLGVLAVFGRTVGKFTGEAEFFRGRFALSFLFGAAFQAFICP